MDAGLLFLIFCVMAVKQMNPIGLGITLYYSYKICP